MVEKLFPDPFLKISKFNIFLGQKLCCIQFIIILCQVEDYRNILKLSSRPLALTSYKAFLKNKKRSGTSLPTSFSAWFLKNNISLLYSIKGCLRYKTTTSQNASSEAQVKNFLFCSKVMFRSQDIQVFVFLNTHDLPSLWRHNEYW